MRPQQKIGAYFGAIALAVLLASLFAPFFCWAIKISDPIKPFYVGMLISLVFGTIGMGILWRSGYFTRHDLPPKKAKANR